MENSLDCNAQNGIEIIHAGLTNEELQELEKARSLPVTFDRDCPETTPERALRFKRVNPPRKTPVTPA